MRYFPPVRDAAGNNAFSCVAIFHFVILTFYLSTSIFLLAHYPPFIFSETLFYI